MTVILFGHQVYLKWCWSSRIVYPVICPSSQASVGTKVILDPVHSIEEATFCPAHWQNACHLFRLAKITFVKLLSAHIDLSF